ncbi:hypothetical protein BOTNAR_0113g00190 [Botryotinia narcissicola]|uniref:Nudix hydrolase domain-containing protein n=1 Tax=Botryotinia narcissicola TaxID=278944 RepID=A0A4Z1IM27_9HELO|nr:hypothetical protein BOTNAR_0113g00190 [Botryotinia narcissicola]
MSSDSKKSYLDLVKACDNFPYDANIDELYKLYLPDDGRVHGYMLPEIVSQMPWSPEFTITQTPPLSVQLHPTDIASNDYSTTCNNAFEKVINEAIDKDIFSTLHGEHSEPYAIPGAKQPVQLERYAASLFGTISRGAHLTIYTRSEEGEMKIWVAKRSAHLFTYPGKFDTTVAGGVRADESPFETIVHEADEEASLSSELIRAHVKSTGVITYMKSSGAGSGGIRGLVTADMIYVYDLEVGEATIPTPGDDEVEGFYLWSVEKVVEELGKGTFKTNSAVVMIDFFVRHGILSQENVKDFAEVVMRIHRKLPFPTAGES